MLEKKKYADSNVKGRQAFLPFLHDLAKLLRDPLVFDVCSKMSPPRVSLFVQTICTS